LCRCLRGDHGHGRVLPGQRGLRPFDPLLAGREVRPRKVARVADVGVEVSQGRVVLTVTSKEIVKRRDFTLGGNVIAHCHRAFQARACLVEQA
jgi:hypothetical protein